MSKDCTNPVSALTADGKPRESYIPPDVTSDEKELFSGIQTGINFSGFDKVILQVRLIAASALVLWIRTRVFLFFF